MSDPTYIVAMSTKLRDVDGKVMEGKDRLIQVGALWANEHSWSGPSHGYCGEWMVMMPYARWNKSAPAKDTNPKYVVAFSVPRRDKDGKVLEGKDRLVKLASLWEKPNSHQGPNESALRGEYVVVMPYATWRGSNDAEPGSREPEDIPFG